MKFNFGEFKYLGIWSADGEAPFICLEPWYNTPDYINSTGKFKDKKNIIELSPNNSFNINFSVEFFDENGGNDNSSSRAKHIGSNLMFLLIILYFLLILY